MRRGKRGAVAVTSGETSDMLGFDPHELMSSVSSDALVGMYTTSPGSPSTSYAASGLKDRVKR
jgi:hypothetical protein